MKLPKDSDGLMKMQFENLASSIFEAKGKTLTEGNQISVTALLQPVKEQLARFRTRIDRVHKSDVEQSATLLKHLESAVGHHHQPNCGEPDQRSQGRQQNAGRFWRFHPAAHL